MHAFDAFASLVTHEIAAEYPLTDVKNMHTLSHWTPLLHMEEYSPLCCEHIVDVMSLLLPPCHKDERMMHFLVKVQREVRLFWTVEVIGMSYWLGLIGILYFGNAESVSPFVERWRNASDLWDILDLCFVWGSTPGSLTMLALLANISVLRISAAYSESEEGSVMRRSRWTFGVTSAISFIGEKPLFVVALAVWLVFGLVFGASLAWYSGSEYDVFETILWYHYGILASGSVILLCFIAGLAAIGMRSCRTRPRVTLPQWCPLFIGWGFGSLIGGALVASWDVFPRVYLAGCLVVFLLGGSMFTEVDILGVWMAGWIKAVTDVVQRRNGMIHWSIASSVQVLMASWMVDVYVYFTYSVLE